MTDAPNGPGPHWSLSDDLKRCNIDFPSIPPVRLSYDADQIEEMIDGLAAMRAAMLPPRPMRDPWFGQALPASSNGRWWVMPFLGDDGTAQGITLALLHEGKGWVAMTLPQAAVDHLLAMIHQHRRTPPGSPAHKTPPAE